MTKIRSIQRFPKKNNFTAYSLQKDYPPEWELSIQDRYKFSTQKFYQKFFNLVYISVN